MGKYYDGDTEWRLMRMMFFRLMLHLMMTTMVVVIPSSVVEAIAIQFFHGRVALQPALLLGGPKWLPLHCKLVIDDCHVFDFVPLNATSTETIQKLIKLQSVPAEVRIIQRPERLLRSNDVDNEQQHLHSSFVGKAEQFCLEYDQDLHLLKNNCWSFAFDLISFILYHEKSKMKKQEED